MKSGFLRKSAGMVALAMFACFSLVAQNQKITGKVVDSNDGSPLPGVTVSIQGRQGAVSTDTDGKFVISANPSTESLILSFIGYKKQTVPLADRTTLTVKLSAESMDMQEVVVVGYGTKKKSQVVGAVASLKASEIQDIPAPNIAAALRNRIAGVSVSSASGRPGASISLNVRSASRSDQAKAYGVTNEPLYVVDGIIVTKDAFDNIDPSMVDDITILKDASAAIYGAAGAKGVVLITTKKGKAGKISISYNGYAGVADAATKPDMLSAYDHASLLNDGYRVANATRDKFFSDADLTTLKTSTTKSWFDELWQSSLTQRHNLSFSGGSDKVTFFAGGSYSNQNANYAGMKDDKYGFRTGISAAVTSELKAEVNFNVDSRNRNSQNGLSENDQNFYRSLITTPKWVPIQINGMPVNFYNFNSNSNSNPLGIINSGYYQKSQSSNYRINANLTYQPEFLKGFTARFQVSQTSGTSNGTIYKPDYKIYDFAKTGNNGLLYTDSLIATTQALGQSKTQLQPDIAKNSGYQGFITLQYGRSIGDHSFDVMVGGEQSASNSESLGVYWLNQNLPDIDDQWAFDQTSLTLQGRNISESKKRSFMGRANYSFKNRYTVEGVFRLDASSNFAKGNIWGFFPSVGLGWVVSEENFFKDNFSFVNYLKLKANFGLVGDDRVNARLWQDRFKVDLNGYNYNENLQAGLNPDVIANPNISWEKARTFNAGFEMALLNDKISLNVDVFRRFNYDIFDKGNNDNFPMYAGFSAPVVNYQERTTWGSEFSIGYRGRIGKEVKFNSSVNFGFSNSVIDRMFYNQYKLFQNTPEDWIISLGTNPKKYNSDNIGLISKGMLRTQADVDALLQRYPNYMINGKVPQVGWLYFEDMNGDGVITENDLTPMFKRIDPFLSLGVSFGFTYKALSLNTNIAADLGGKEFYDSYSRRAASEKENVPAFWKDHWTPENPDAKFPRYDDASINKGWNSTFWAVNGTMIRINNMTLSYKLPDRIAKSVGMSNLRIMATGDNLWVLRNPLKFKDPYSSYIYDYPTLRTVSLGLSVNL